MQTTSSQWAYVYLRDVGPTATVDYGWQWVGPGWTLPGTYDSLPPGQHHIYAYVLWWNGAKLVPSTVNWWIEAYYSQVATLPGVNGAYPVSSDKCLI